ncbi:MAG: hypothetical protein ABR584_10275 [Candidatus Baltobacteraceae bacterium]
MDRRELFESAVKAAQGLDLCITSELVDHKHFGNRITELEDKLVRFRVILDRDDVLRDIGSRTDNEWYPLSTVIAFLGGEHDADEATFRAAFPRLRELFTRGVYDARKEDLAAFSRERSHTLMEQLMRETQAGKDESSVN